MAIKLIVGLGNPGVDYIKTRHNAGFWFIDALASDFNARLKPAKRFKAEHVKVIANRQEVHLLKPMTFMNNSGQAVAACAHYYKIEAAEILIAHDELDLDPGTVKLKKSGGHGGHNGLRDITAQLATKNFNRLRLGIGHPGHSSQVVNYVLHNIAKDQLSLLEGTIIDAMNIIPQLILGDIEQAMQTLHTKSNTISKNK